MIVQLYNTLHRRKEELKSLKKGKVGLYSCGPTVYHYQHIGNMRAYIFVDLLRRTLEASGMRVQHVMNITDVGHLTGDTDAGEDKMEKEAKTIKDVKKIAKRYTDEFLLDLKRLNIQRPHVLAPASSYIVDQLKLIRRLFKKGFAYDTNEAVYFDVSKFPSYNKLSGRNLAAQTVGAREEVKIDPEKRNPYDFALWFKRVGRFKNHIQYWQSPWGDGFPGWHIECSSISSKFLGQPFDIHTGGVDHIGTHHTNEIAQSEAALGKPLANVWMHNEHLNLGEKMSKSKGNVYRIKDLIDKGYHPLAFRYYVLNAKYRTPLQFSWEALDAAQNVYTRIVSVMAGLKATAESETKKKSPEAESLRTKFFDYLADDLNTPSALSVFWLVFTSPNLTPSDKYNLFLEFDKVLGLGLAGVKAVRQETLKVPASVAKLIAEREAHRKVKDWKRADEVRVAIEKLGWIVKDTPLGQEVNRS